MLGGARYLYRNSLNLVNYTRYRCQNEQHHARGCRLLDSRNCVRNRCVTLAKSEDCKQIAGLALGHLAPFLVE
jgi:hypothetical protein